MVKVRQKVYDTYWYFAAERQNIFFRKLADLPAPWTNDPILQTYKFCNVYRAIDRVSQDLIKRIYSFKTSPQDTLFRIFLFRLLNRTETFDLLEMKFGKISLSNFKFRHYTDTLSKISPIYGNAFILCANKSYGFDRKHENHLALLEHIFVKTTKGDQLVESKSLRELFARLKELPLIGNFMAYQLAIDFNYSGVFNFSENDFTVAGPGALRGIKKCFEDTGDKSDADIIRFMVENQDREFARLGFKFQNLWGRKLHSIDCQGLFCEVDKYSRVKFPDLKSRRIKIKTKYQPKPEKVDYFFPPKWQIVLTSFLQNQPRLRP